MSPALLLTLILAALLATLPVRRLHQAGWPTGALVSSWVVYLILAIAGLEFGAGSRYVLPVLVVLFAAPFAAGQARLEKAARLLGARPTPDRPVINVTPPDAPGLAGPDPDPAPRRRGRKPPTEYR
jgi:hypothetical protein